MADGSRSWAAIEAFAARLRGIRVDQGYLTDVGQAVWTNDHQRADDRALGLMIYSESISGPGLDGERPGKPVRDLALLIEAATGTELEDAQANIHAVIEDIERCLERAPSFVGIVGPGLGGWHLTDITILDRPEGAAVVAMQARVVARYLR